MKLRFNKRRALALHRLPFIGKRDNADGRHAFSPLDWWCVPDTGDYSDGNDAGRYLAVIYMKYLLDNHDKTHHELPWIVSDMFKGVELKDSVKGQVVGFLATLGGFLSKSAPLFSEYLNSHESEQLLKKVNASLFESKN